MRLVQTSKQPFGSKVCKAAKGHQTNPLIGSGWREDGDHFAIDWKSGDPAPAAELELLSFSCNKVMSTSYLQLPGKWFEVHGRVQAIRL